MGFQHMNKYVHGAASSKGGGVRKKKGLAALSPEHRRYIAAMGGKKKHDNKRNQVGKNETPERGDSPNLADILGNIDDL